MQDFIDAIVLAFVAAFLLGSIPFGLIISKVFYKTDIREHGSGNIGTTNAMRTIGKVGGAAVFVLDFGKGLASGFLGIAIGQFFINLRGVDAAADGLWQVLSFLRITQMGDTSDFMVWFAEVVLAVSFLGCTWGHIFSPWLKFKGGKGIAVAIGCIFVTYGVIGACLELLIFIVLVVATRRVSIGSIAAAGACPFFALYLFWGNWLAVIACSIAGLTVVWAHRENIKRLMQGTESRIGKDASS